MSTSKEALKRWRNKTKERIVLSMGGKCQICGYDKCNSALDLHHINQHEKEFSLGSIRANPQKWELIVEELRKCILLCSNCHREIHAGIVTVPKNYQKFDEKYFEYKKLDFREEEDNIPCPVCQGEKNKGNVTCSLKCAGQYRYRVDWEKYDLNQLFKDFGSFYAVGKFLGVSDVAVKKRMVKENLL